MSQPLRGGAATRRLQVRLMACLLALAARADAGTNEAGCEIIHFNGAAFRELVVTD